MFVLNIIILSLYLIGGITLTIVSQIVNNVPIEIKLISLSLGMILISCGMSLLTFIAHHEDTEVETKWLVLFPIISIAVLGGLYFLFTFLAKRTDSSDWNITNICIIVLLSLGAVLTISFIILQALAESNKTFVFFSLATPVVSLITIGSIYLIRNFIAAGPSALVIIIAIVVGFKYFTGGSSDYSSSSKKVVNDNGTDKELTYRGNGDYVDNYGDSWHSDDDGKTAYKK